MDRLPECLLLRILASLPPQHVLRLRLVCKAWNALLSSSHFLQTLAFQSSHLHIPCFAMAPLPLHGSPHCRLLFYSPYLGTWLHTHFPLLSSSAPAPTPVSAMLSAGHGNVVAIAASMPTPTCIRVFNLLTSSHLDIFPPLFPDPKFSALSILPLERSLIVFNLFIFCHDADGSDGSYHLVLDEQSPAHHTLFIYTSKTESWKSVSAPTQCRSPPQWIYSYSEIDLPKIDANKANLCFWNPTGSVDKADLVFWNSRERMIAEYHIESNEWENVSVFSPKFEADFEDQSMQKAYLAGGSVFKCQEGRVVLVCADVMDECLSLSSPLMWRQIKGFWVWELQSRESYGRDSGRLWVQVARTPHSFWEAYYVERTELMFKPKFIYDGTSICMTSAKHTSSQQNSSAFSRIKLGRYKPPLVYNLDLDSWSYLPRYGGEADDLVGLFSFKPMFKALAQNNTTLIYRHEAPL